METKSTITERKKIGELLIEAGIIRPEELPIGLQQAEDRALRLGEVLVMLRYLSAEDLEAVLAAQSMIGDDSISEADAVEALKIASTHRMPFAKALKQIESKPQGQLASADQIDELKLLTDELSQTELNVGTDHRDLVPILLKIGDVRMRNKQHSDAEYAFKRAQQIYEKAYGPKHSKLTGSLTRLANLYAESARYQEAEALQWKVIDITQTTFGSEHQEVAKAHKALARLMEAQGRLKEAEQFYLSFLKIMEKIHGPDHPDLVDGLRHLASFWKKQGKRPEKKRLGDILVESDFVHHDQLQQALQHCQKTGMPLGQALVKLNILTEEDLRPALQAQLLVGDGVLPIQLAVRALKDSRQGRIFFEDALKQLGWQPDSFTTQELKMLLTTADELMTAEIALGSDHAGVAVLSMKLGDNYMAQKKYSEAEPLYKRAIAILEKFFGPKDLEVSVALGKLAKMYTTQGKLIEAERLFWRALEIKQQVLGQNHLDVAESLDDLGYLQIKQGNPDQAERLFLSSISIKEKVLGKTHVKVIDSLVGLADIYYSESKLEQAEGTYLRLIKIKQQQGDSGVLLAPLLEKLGDIYFAKNDHSNAETQYEIALELRETADDYSIATAELMEKYAILMKVTKRFEESSKMDQKAQLLRRGFKPS